MASRNTREGRYFTQTFNIGGEKVEVRIYLSALESIAKQAAENRSGKSTFGPVEAKVIKKKKSPNKGQEKN